MQLDTNIEPLPDEEFRDIVEWKGHTIQEGYQVSNLGRVRHLPHSKRQIGKNGNMIEHPYPGVMLNGGLDADGYRVVLIRDENLKSVDGRVHQLVAKYFIGDPPSIEHTQVNHKDGNKLNNRVDNLEWATPLYNNLHARLNGLNKPGCSQAVKVKFKECDDVFFSKAQANKFLGYTWGYFEHHLRRGLPIIQKGSGKEFHIEYIGGIGNEK